MILPPSIHEFHVRDLVTRDGIQGIVLDARPLHAQVRWEDGQEEEVEQFDGAIWVMRRAVDPPAPGME